MLEVDEQHKTEHSVLCPTNPYAASKAAAETFLQRRLNEMDLLR